MKRHASTALLLTLLALGAAPPSLPGQTPAAVERGIGPFSLQTRRGPLTVRLLKRDAQFVWVDQLAASGKWIEIGLTPSDIVRFDVQRPRFFDLVESASTPEQIGQLTAALKKVTDTQKAFRDLPGLLVDEAFFLQGRLLEKQSQWKAALAVYEDIAKQPYHPAQAEAARLRAGVCYARLEQFEKALPLLDAPVSDEDLGLLSDVVFSRARARAAAQDHERAVLDYLYLVVFQPFVQTNEARCLSAALPSYAAMQDWDGLWKSLQVLRTQYAALDETRRAEEFVKPYAKELEKEKAFALPAPSAN